MADQFEFGIKLDADTRQADNMAASIEDIGDASDDVKAKLTDAFEKGARASEKARLSSREFNGIMREARRIAERTGGSIEDAFQEIQDAARAAGIELEDHTLEAMERIGRQGPDELEKVRAALRQLDEETPEIEIDVDTEGPITKTQDMMNEVRSSITESMGELAGAFAENGFNMEDSVEGVVEVSSEAAGALPGPWGLAGSALVAVAAGVYGEWKKTTEKITEDASAMYQDLLSSGADFLSDQFFQKRLAEFFDPMGESYQDNIESIQLLEDLGIPADQAARAMVGYGDDTKAALSAVRGALAESSEDIRAQGVNWLTTEAQGKQSLWGVQAALQGTQKSTREANTAVDAYRGAIEDIPGDKNTDVNVSDNGSTKRTQRKVDNIHGGSTTVDVYADTSSADYTVGAFRDRVGRPITVPITPGFIGAQGSFYP